jgi:hypothetical protein
MAPVKAKKAAATSNNSGKRSRTSKKKAGIENGARRSPRVEQGTCEERGSGAPVTNINTNDGRDAAQIVQDMSELEREMADIRGEFTTILSEVIELTCRYTAALEKEQMQNAELQRQIEEMMTSENSAGRNMDSKPIPRPRGTAGTDFSIQEAMGLAGSAKKYETYKAIQVCQHRIEHLSCAIEGSPRSYSVIFEIWQ